MARAKLIAEVDGVEDVPGNVRKCKISCRRCRHKRGDWRCSRRTCNTLPYCWQHMREVYHIEVKKSTIPGAGKGLFVYKPRGQRAAIIQFRKGDKVIPPSLMKGVTYTHEEFNRLFPGDKFHQNAVQLGRSENVTDPTCKRYAWLYINYGPNHSNRVPRPKLANVVANHSNNSERVWLEARRDIYQGEEIFWNYGMRSLVNPANTFKVSLKRRVRAPPSSRYQ